MDKEQLITKYLRNELTGFEQNKLDELLVSDSKFKDQFEFEIQVKKAFYKKEYDKNKQFLTDIERKISSKSSNKKWYVIAASIILLISVSVYWSQVSQSPEKLFTDFYQVASNTSHPIVRDNTVSNDLTKAFIAYESEQYSEAQTLFAKAYKSSNNTKLLFYEAICYLETGDHKNAIKTFLIHQNQNDKLQEKSKWYLALTYLKNNEKEEAKTLLEEITNASSNYNYKKAVDLLSKL